MGWLGLCMNVSYSHGQPGHGASCMHKRLQLYAKESWWIGMWEGVNNDLITPVKRSAGTEFCACFEKQADLNSGPSCKICEEYCSTISLSALLAFRFASERLSDLHCRFPTVRGFACTWLVCITHHAIY
jgi:hypothetical protein